MTLLRRCGARNNILFVALCVLCLVLANCSGRIIRRDDVTRCTGISIVSATNNSWFGWEETFPETLHMSYDMLSVAVYQTLSAKASSAEIKNSFRSGDLMPGKVVAGYAVTKLERALQKKKIPVFVEHLGPNPRQPYSPTKVTISTEIFARILSILPEVSRNVVTNIKDYIQCGDPRGWSWPDGMPLVVLDGSKVKGIDQVVSKSKHQDVGYLILSGAYRKDGLLIAGNGLGKIVCELDAVIYNSKGQPIWHTTAGGEGSRFKAGLYYVLFWNELEESARKAASMAIKEIADRIREDFPSFF